MTPPTRTPAQIAEIKRLRTALETIIFHCNSNSAWLKADIHGSYMGSFYYSIKDTAVAALHEE